MKISTRQYLEDLRKAERKGYAKGFNEACDKHERNEEKREMYKNVDRLDTRVDELRMSFESAFGSMKQKVEATTDRLNKAFPPSEEQEPPCNPAEFPSPVPTENGDSFF